MRRVVSTLAVMALLPACADRASSAAEVPVEDVDAQAYCPQVDAGPLEVIAEGVGAIRSGACGDLIYAVGEQAFWYRPGIGSVEIDAQIWTTRFAPSGHLLSWERATGKGLILADTRTGALTELGEVQTHGLVPAPGSEHGADLWICGDGELELAGPVESGILATGVDCESVVSSSGSPRVAYADSEGAVYFGDLEQLETWAVEDDDYRHQRVVDGLYRDDWLSLDHDGRVIAHQLAHWEGDEDVDADWRVIDGMRVFADGEARANWSGSGSPYDVSQQPRRAAPVLFRAEGGLTAIADGQRHDHGGPLGSMDLDARGRASMLNGEGGTLFRTSADASSLDALVELDDGLGVEVSASGEWIVVEHLNPDCVDDPEACEGGHTSLSLWHEGEGLSAEQVQGYGWDHVAVTDAGFLVTVATNHDTHTVDLLVFDGQLALHANASVGGPGYVRSVVVLADGRVLVEVYSTVGRGRLFLVDPSAAAGERITVVPEAEAIANQLVFVGASQETLAFAVESEDAGPHRLFAGAMPSQ